MTGVTGRIAITANLTLSNPAIGTSVPAESVNFNFGMGFDAGNAALGKADVMYHAVRNLAGSATDSLDLTGTLKDSLGNTIANAEIMAIIIKSDPANLNNILVGPAAANGFLGPWNAAADRTKIEPGNVLMVTSINGWPVTAATADLLVVINAAGVNAVNYEILVVGRTVVG